jgi:hypothetical protein
MRLPQEDVETGPWGGSFALMGAGGTKLSGNTSLALSHNAASSSFSTVLP